MNDNVHAFTSTKIKVATFDQCINWAKEAANLIGLEQYYPFYLDSDIDFSGLTFSNGEIAIKHKYSSKEPFLATYLHEVGHVICDRVGLDHSPDGSRAHSKYFAALVFMMYIRADIISYLSIYDFSDTEHRENGSLKLGANGLLTNNGWPNDNQLVSRFRFAVLHGRQLAESALSVEQAAVQLRSGLQAAWGACSVATPSRPPFGSLRRFLALFA